LNDLLLPAEEIIDRADSLTPVKIALSSPDRAGFNPELKGSKSRPGDHVLDLME
jgi:hypothetical protein